MSPRPSKKSNKQPQPNGVHPGLSADDYFRTIRPVMDLMASALGNRCELVLHDFRQPDRSIIAVAGDVTGRRAGGSVTQIGMQIMREGDAAKDNYTYVTSTPNGLVLKSVTVPLRDEDGHVFGALCVNVDITEFWMLGQSIQTLVGASAEIPKPVTFVDDIDGVIADVLREETKLIGRPLSELSRHERLRLLKALDFRGVFSLQRSIPQIADHLGLSRATLYNDLKLMRQENGSDGEGQPVRASRHNGHKFIEGEGNDL
ncbi:MAG TPA: PAS domain-containing protein [Devosiaceae bacterium]|jgi:predicted transcriptional regulator YheO